MGIVNRAGAMYMATGIDNTGLYKGKREAMGIIKAMAGEVTSFDIFGGIGISAAAAFAKAAKDAYTFEKDFQKSMFEVASISGTIKGSLTDYMNSIMEMTRQIPVAANDSAKALYQIVSAGHDGADAMKILEVSAKAAVGGVTETATAADAITTVLNAYKMSASEAGKVSDMLFMTAKLGKTTMGELGQTIAQAAPIAASYGVGIEQVLSAVASLTKQGTPTAQAMTQIRASIIGVSKVLGDGAYDGRTYQEALAEVAARANGSESELRKLVPEIEAVNAVLGMTGNNANAAASDLGQLQNSIGASEAAFKTMRVDADNQLKLLQNNITATLRPLGEGILKEVAGVAEKMNDAFNNGDMENSLQTMETLIKLVSVAFVGYKVATLDVLKTTNAEAAATKIMETIKASYHKVIGDGIIQKETERLSQEAYIASLESSITVEQRAALEKQNLKQGSKEYADALSDIAVNAKNSADQEVESLTKSLAKNREKLSSAKERVEMSKEATQAAKEELNAALQSNDISATEAAQSKVISAAKREESATNDMNTVSRKINNQEKRLGIAQTRADSASTVLNSATTAGNAAATTVSSRAHNFLAAAKLKATIATRTLTAALLANPLGAFLTVVSLAASAWFMFSGNTEKAKTKLQEFREEQDKLKESTNNLMNTLYDTNEADRIRLEALEKLKEMYPEVWKGVTLENLALKDRNKTLKETNTLRDKEAENKLKSLMLDSRKKLSNLKEEDGRVIFTDNINGTQTTQDNTSAIKRENEVLRDLEKQYYATQTSKQRLIEESLPVDARISIYEKELKDLQTQIEKATGAKKEFSLTDWGDSPKLPTFEDMPKFSDQFNLQLLENQARETKEKLETAKKSKGTGKKSGASTSLTEDQKREAEKRKNTLEDISKTVLGVELKLQQERVALLADGREKALAEIEVERKARLQAIDDEEKELKKKYTSVGRSMPKSGTDAFNARKGGVNTDAGYKTESVNKDYDQKEIDFQKELSSVYLTEEEKRKQAIQDRYDDLRRMQKEALDNELRNIEQSKISEKEAADAKTKAQAKYNAVIAGIGKAQTFDETKGLLDEYQDYTDQRIAIEEKFNNDIATLQEARKKYEQEGNAEKVQQTDRAIAQATKDKGQGLMQLDYDKLKESPEYVRAFENLKQTSSETLSSLLSQLENAKRTAAKVLSPDQLREYTTTIQEIMNEMDSRNPFQSLSDKKQELAEAEQELAEAQMALENARQTAETVKGGGKVEYTTTKFNQKTGKIDSTKAYLTEAQALDNVKDKTDKYNKSKDNVVEKSAKVKKAEKEVTEQIDELSKTISDLGSVIGGSAGEIIGLIGNIGSFTMMAMTGVEAAADTSAQAISTVEKASVILAIIGAAVQIATKIFDLFGKDTTTEKYEDAKEAYESYINILDRVIEKQLELAESLSGDNANAAYEKAIEAIKEQSRNAKVLGQQYLNSGASGKSRSKGYKEVEDMSWEGWNQAAQALGMTIDQFKEKMGGRMTGLFDLTDEQLADLQSDAGIFWSQLDSDTQDYATQVADGVAKVAEVMEQRMTDVTLIDVDSLRSDFQDLLTDMDSASADFADNFEEYMKNAVLNVMLKEDYMKQLTKWREKFYNAMDGGLTKDEYDALKSEGQKLSEEMAAKRDLMKELYGWTDEENEKKDGVTGQLKAEMTEGTASQLVGLWNMTATDIRALKELTAEHFRQAKPYMLNVESILDETRHINANTKRSADNTDGLIEELREGFFSMNGRLKSIEDNTKNSRSRG